MNSLLDLTSATKLEPTGSYYFFRAIELDREGRSAAAIRDCTRAIDLGSSDRTKVLKIRSDCYRKLNDIDSALLDLNACIKLRPAPDLFQRRFSLLMIKGKNVEALLDIDKAIKLDGKNGEFHFLRGSVLNKLGEHQKALKEFELASVLDPNDERFTTSRVATYQTLKTSRKKQQ